MADRAGFNGHPDLIPAVAAVEILGKLSCRRGFNDKYFESAALIYHLLRQWGGRACSRCNDHDDTDRFNRVALEVTPRDNSVFFLERGLGEAKRRKLCSCSNACSHRG
jgi:hypothetical protein